MRGPKSDSFAFHTSQADGSEVKGGKHHTGTGAAKFKRARKQNPKTNVNEDMEEKTWQPVAATILQVAESKPVNDIKFVQNLTKNTTIAQIIKNETKIAVPQKVSIEIKKNVTHVSNPKNNATKLAATKI